MGPGEELNIVMPFVTVQSYGGPHDDESYTRGWEMGALDEHLKQCAALGSLPAPRTISIDSGQQADLIAMRHGFHTHHQVLVDGWIGMSFLWPTQDETEVD